MAGGDADQHVNALQEHVFHSLAEEAGQARRGVTRTAAMGLERQTLQEKIRQLGITRE